MREELLHFIWQYKKLATTSLCTSQGEDAYIVHTGFANLGEGPDFFNAKIEIAGQLWAGNVEMHLKSSDWYAHHHETDPNYDNVILHVVWEDDVHVFRKDRSQIPTLELKNIVSNELLKEYGQLMHNGKTSFINCEKNIGEVGPVIWKNWLERLYLERLEQKSHLVLGLLKKTKNDWETVLFLLLCKSFGSKVNGSFFLDRAMQLDFSIVRKVGSDTNSLESLLLGHFGLLEDTECTDAYFLQSKKEYRYLKQKFGLPALNGTPAFYGLRPANFPTVRISQLSKIYGENHNLFQKLMKMEDIVGFYQIFKASTTPYWQDHYTFAKVSKKRKKQLSSNFIDLLLINAIVPLKFCYSNYLGNTWDIGLMDLMSAVPKENNSIVKGFENLGIKTESALESQAKIQLHHEYCTKNRCLQCTVGNHLLNRNAYF